uniref:Replicase n=1 Tax=Taishun Tick Virus TaxID=1608090 RepID=A0A482LW32_9RHAB|nr:RNA-dependent RNA polymerase [Taishun Tick Virus]
MGQHVKLKYWLFLGLLLAMAAFEAIADFTLFEGEDLLAKEDWEESEFETLDYELLGPATSGPSNAPSETTIINVDYNLNSPLTTDLVDHALDRLRTGKKIPRYLQSTPTLSKSVDLLKSTQTPWKSFKGCLTYHSWVGALLVSLKGPPITLWNIFTSLLTVWNPCYDTLETFIRVWLRHGLPSRTSLQKFSVFKELELRVEGERVQKELELFWFFHRVTMMMNSSSERERRNLQESGYTNLEWEIKEYDKNNFLASGFVPNLGKIYVTRDLVALPDQFQLLDRNMVLMAKDLFVARVSSKLSLVGRPQQHVFRQRLFKLSKFYQLGDKLLAKYGNRVFPAVKIIEAVCNHRIIHLAQEHRKLVLISTDFGDFIKSAIKDLAKEEGIDAQEFFDHILNETDVEAVLLYYGSFRHWGHPFIDYQAGLEKLYRRVTEVKNIDVCYANSLASDLAYKVLYTEFGRQKKWFVDPNQLEPGHPFRTHVINGTWPTLPEIEDFGDHWHELPLTACYKLPDFLDPSILYADKSHSLNRDEFVRHIRQFPGCPIPSKRVLTTALHTPPTHVGYFLKQINDYGLEDNDLIIGLKPKEREVKSEGRFFALMSWKLREYFVITEYLIKKFYLPLFGALTMADDYVTVVKKLLSSSSGQGLSDYSQVNYSNHLDYSAWNNHQRKEATDPVFKVMGQFFGLPNLFTRTHEFFQKSWIYFPDRADQIFLDNQGVPYSPDNRFFWRGQAGGLEGLRQKGWTLLNLLMILRESKIRNTRVTVLAQGDNQVVNTSYPIPGRPTKEALVQFMVQIQRNNTAIMNAILDGTTKLGLTLNREETMVSSEYLNYGKVPLIRGQMFPLETKRWSRTTSLTNDQLPSFGNILSSVSTNALTVCQASSSVIPSLINYVFFGLFSSCLLCIHNPLLQGSPWPKQRLESVSGLEVFFVRALFVDPSLGGISGTSLTRFMIRQFPDPVTESLVFWKAVLSGAPTNVVRDVGLEAGNPVLRRFRSKDFNRLVERPTSLNLPRGISALSLIQEQVRNNLYVNHSRLGNPLFREAASHIKTEETQLLSFLESVRPCFPRFLSEFKSASYFGIVDSLISLFENSRTIRRQFSRKFSNKVDRLLRESEHFAVLALHRKLKPGKIWKCSAQHADFLRTLSWGRPLVGATVPHPFEYLEFSDSRLEDCSSCLSQSELIRDRIMVTISRPFDSSLERTGPLSPYLGSYTIEATTLFNPWEKEMKLPFLARASRLRQCVGWLTDPSSKVADSIYKNLELLTGTTWTRETLLSERTGTVVHRFRSSRQDHGGFVSVNPNCLRYLSVTADTMRFCKQQNWDFMYQASLIYAQLEVSQLLLHQRLQGVNPHFHPSCHQCFRQVEDITLDSGAVYNPMVKGTELQKISAAYMAQSTLYRPYPTIQEGDWMSLSVSLQSFHIGAAQGLLFGILKAERGTDHEDPRLFPMTFLDKVDPDPYFAGLMKGLLSAVCCEGIFYRDLVVRRRPMVVLSNIAMGYIKALADNLGLITTTNSGVLHHYMTEISHKISPAYPGTVSNSSVSVFSVLQLLWLHRRFRAPPYNDWGRKLWMFADFQSPKLMSISCVCHELYQWFFLKEGSSIPKRRMADLKTLVQLYSSLQPVEKNEEQVFKRVWADCQFITTEVLLCKKDVRYAASELPRIRPVPTTSVTSWGREFVCGVDMITLNFSAYRGMYPLGLHIPQVNIPLISGLRLAQLATGAHYKIRAILRQVTWFGDFICGGDGSGGMTSAILRMSRSSRGIFNSLLDLAGADPRGVALNPPEAITILPERVRTRCVNYDTCMYEPSDLTQGLTWSSISRLVNDNNLNIGLIVLDMELRDPESSLIIFRHLRTIIAPRCPQCLVVVFKTYTTYLYASQFALLEEMARGFRKISAATTALTSSHSSEVYLICEGQNNIPSPDYHITTDSVLDLINVCRSKATPRQELIRALAVKRMDTTTGVPSCLIPDPETEFLSLVHHSGILAGEGITIIREMQRRCISSPEEIVSCLLGLASIILNRECNVTRLTLKPKAIPSDPSIQKMAAWYYATWLYVSWITESLVLYRLLLQRIPGRLDFSYSPVVSAENPERYAGHWNWTRRLEQKKSFWTLTEYALMGTIIRCYRKYFSTTLYSQFPNHSTLLTQLESFTTSFNKNLKKEIILERQDLFGILTDPTPVHVPSHFLQGYQSFEPQSRIPLGPVSDEEENDDLLGLDDDDEPQLKTRSWTSS